MSERQIKNAIIERVTLGKEDHGIMTCSIWLKYDGGSQCFGGYALDQWDPKKKRRVGTAYGFEWIIRLLDTLEVSTIDQLKGQSVRADASWTQVYRIGHFLKEKWFSNDDVLSEEARP